MSRQLSECFVGGELVREARARGLGIMLDMVLCHTSTAHEWFQRALAGDERYQRYYILRDGRGSTGSGDPGEPPTNWTSIFGGSMWQWEPRLGKWYLHMHDVSQPDLDWTNPDVRREMADVVRFWRDRGVAGFRFDVVNLISKSDVFEDDPHGSGRALIADGPHIHEYLQGLVRDAGIGDMLTVGEMASTTLDACVRYTRLQSHELDMAFNFHHLKVDYRGGDKWELMDPDIARLRELFRTWQERMQEGRGWNALFWNNHDQPRAISRFGGRGGAGQAGSSWEKVGKMLAVCTHLMQGTPYIYQGEEIGMTNPGYTSIEDFDDVESRNYYAILLERGKSPAEALRIVNERSRDDARTPHAVERRAARRLHDRGALDQSRAELPAGECGGRARRRGFDARVLPRAHPPAQGAARGERGGSALRGCGGARTKGHRIRTRARGGRGGLPPGRAAPSDGALLVRRRAV